MIIVILSISSFLYLAQYLTFKSRRYQYIFCAFLLLGNWGLVIQKGHLNVVMTLLIITGWLLLPGICFSDYLRKRVFNLLFQLLVNITSLYVGGLFELFTSETGFSNMREVGSILVMIFFHIIWLKSMFCVKEKFYYGIEFGKQSYDMGNITLFITAFILIFFEGLEFNWRARILLLIFSFFSIYMNLVLFIWETRYQREVARYEIIKKQLEMHQQVIEQRYKEMDQRARLCHDYKHQMQIVQDLLNEQCYDAAQKLLSEMLKKATKKGTDVFCKNYYLNTILREKCQQAKLNHIKFETDCELGNSIFINPADLCSVFFNLINNALEASEKVPEQEERRVSVYVRETRGMLCIIVKNTIKEKPFIQKSNRIFSTKKEEGIHGVGIKNVEEIAKQYNGALFLEAEDYLFTAKIIMENRENGSIL